MTDVKNAPAGIDPAALESFRGKLRGQLIGAADPDYEAARKVYNGMIDKRPLLIARCADVADVVASVDFARKSGLLLAVRGGGHNGAGFGVCDGGLVVDLGGLKSVRVDPRSRTVRVGAGCTQGDMDHATHGFGLAVPSGVISTTGVSGLTLGGGQGYLSRKYGLAIDSLLEADLVLADGRLVTASRSENEDLFWAIRGGGGNFGIATSFLFQGHGVDMVQAGPMFWDLDQAGEVMAWFRRYMPGAPEDLSGFLALQTVPPVPVFPEHLHGRTVCAVIWCCLDAARTDEFLKPARSIGPPVLDLVGPMPFPALQSMFDPLLPPGLQWYWKADFFGDVADEAIAIHLDFARKLPTPLSLMHLYPVDGAVHRVAGDETAFGFRQANWSMVIAGVDPDPGKADLLREWARSYWDALHPYSLGAGYVNFTMDEGTGRVERMYGGNYARLAGIKRKYDPANLFRVNQNIKPA